MLPLRAFAVGSALLLFAVAGCGSGAAQSNGTGGGCSAVQGSCRSHTGFFCYEYGGVPSAALTTLMEECKGDPDEPDMWSSTACTHAGAVGGCRTMQGDTCAAVWAYVGTASDAKASCAQQGGTWVNP